MIITYAYAMRLVKAGKAPVVATCRDDITYDDITYVVINRHDIQRTDHAKCPSNVSVALGGEAASLRKTLSS